MVVEVGGQLPENQRRGLRHIPKLDEIKRRIKSYEVKMTC